MPLDPDFGRSRFVMKLYPYSDNEGGVATRATAFRRLLDPGKDHPGAPKDEEGSKRLEEPNLLPRSLPQPKPAPRRKSLVLYTSPLSRKIAAPTSQAFSPNREGGVPDTTTTIPQGSPLEGNEARMVRQLETRPISPEQLIAEVKRIYAGLVMVVKSAVDNQQAVATFDDGQIQPRLNDEQWQASIALHRALLHEHHKRTTILIGAHVAFTDLAYSMMAFLYETVPAFGNTWVECLGDLGRYRMAIEDDDVRDTEFGLVLLDSGTQRPLIRLHTLVVYSIISLSLPNPTFSSSYSTVAKARPWRNPSIWLEKAY
ncbi:hypothetical protein HOY80DRAFT_1134282 [Tuber brumale]|nr:hypothetical protein HOY80DRAFT_1134282 [Tuber brumale]